MCELAEVTIKPHLINSFEVISSLSEDLVQKIKHASEFTIFFFTLASTSDFASNTTQTALWK